MKKNTPTTSRLRLFSLVELMVAMGMLVVMMGFLFQFVIGAQRIWSASNRNASTFTDAQLVFSLLERDLHNATFQHAEEFPGRGIPMYLENDGTNFTNFFLVSTAAAPATSGTAAQNRVGYYPILYSLELDTGAAPTPPFPSTPFILYRDVLDREFVSADSYKSFAYFGSAASSLPTTWCSNPSRKEILCRNIKALTLAALPIPDSAGKFPSKPRAVKLTLTLYEPNLGANESSAYPERVFNKIIFLK